MEQEEAARAASLEVKLGRTWEEGPPLKEVTHTSGAHAATQSLVQWFA